MRIKYTSYVFYKGCECIVIRYLKQQDPGLEYIIIKSSTQSYPLHNHVSTAVASMVIDGAIQLTIDQTSSVYHANQIFVIPPYTPHKLTAHTPYTLYTLCVDKNSLRSIPWNQLKEQISFAFIAALRHIDLTAMEPSSIKAWAKRLASMDRLPTEKVCLEPHINRICRCIETHPESNLSLEEMARSAFITKYDLIRKFKQAFGLTPHQFQIQNRVRKAQRLFLQTKTLTEAAFTAGFCDQSHFIKSFEKLLGLTPSAYKKSYRNISNTK